MTCVAGAGLWRLALPESVTSTVIMHTLVSSVIIRLCMINFNIVICFTYVGQTTQKIVLFVCVCVLVSAHDLTTISLCENEMIMYRLAS